MNIVRYVSLFTMWCFWSLAAMAIILILDPYEVL